MTLASSRDQSLGMKHKTTKCLDREGSGKWSSHRELWNGWCPPSDGSSSGTRSLSQRDVASNTSLLSKELDGNRDWLGSMTGLRRPTTSRHVPHPSPEAFTDYVISPSKPPGTEERREGVPDVNVLQLEDQNPKAAPAMIDWIESLRDIRSIAKVAASENGIVSEDRDCRPHLSKRHMDSLGLAQARTTPSDYTSHAVIERDEEEVRLLTQNHCDSSSNGVSDCRYSGEHREQNVSLPSDAMIDRRDSMAPFADESASKDPEESVTERETCGVINVDFGKQLLRMALAL